MSAESSPAPEQGAEQSGAEWYSGHKARRGLPAILAKQEEGATCWLLILKQSIALFSYTRKDWIVLEHVLSLLHECLNVSANKQVVP